MDTPQSNDQIQAQIGEQAERVIVGKNITYVETQHIHAPAEPAGPPADFAPIEDRYREQVVKHYNKLALTGLPERDPSLHEIALEQIFVKLNIELPQPAGPDFLGVDGQYHPRGYFYGVEGKYHPPGSYYNAYDGKYHPPGDSVEINDKAERELRRQEMTRRRPEPVTLSVAEALRRHSHLTIIGGPGSGKTTLTRWLAVIFARREQAKSENLGAALTDDRLPILLELRRFAERFVNLSQQPAVPDLAAEIATFISQHAYYPGTPADFIQQALREGRCLLLLDGLDEIADLKARQLLSDAIQAFLQHTTPGYRQNLLLVTSRPHGYHSISLGAFQECEVKPFSKDDIVSFIRHWYTNYSAHEQDKADDLITKVQVNDHVRELATTPLLSTLIIIIYHKNGTLPSHRVDLYLQCCKLLLFTWEENKSVHASEIVGHEEQWKIVLKRLELLAFWLHNEKKQLSAPEDEFEEQLTPALQEERKLNSSTASYEARRFIIDIRNRSGILQSRGDGKLEFIHRTFQEYLAARYIATQTNYIALVMVHLHEAWWREVHLLVIGYLGSSIKSAQKAAALIEQIIGLYPEPISFLRPYFPNSILPLRWRTMPGRLWPSLQWQTRLAWMQGREWELALRGSLECTSPDLPSASTSIEDYALQFLLRIIYDPAHNQSYSFIFDSNYCLNRQIALWGNFLHQLPSTPLIIDKLIAILNSPEKSLQIAAIHVLGLLKLALPAVINVLLNALENTEPSVRRVAAEALGQLGQATTIVINPLLNALKDSEADVRNAAAKALGQLNHLSPLVIETLLTDIKKPELPVRRAATEVIGQLGQSSPTVIEHLLVALKNPDMTVRGEAARALGLSGQTSPIIIKALLATIKDPKEAVQVVAARTMLQLGHSSPEIIEVVLNAIKASSPYIRSEAAQALGQLRQASPKIIEALLTTVKDPTEPVRAATVRGLRHFEIGDSTIIEVFITNLKSKTESQRVMAAQVIGQLGQSSDVIVEALIISLKDSSWLVRAAATEAFMGIQIDDVDLLRRVLIALNQRLYDNSFAVRRAALIASNQLVEGRPLPGYRWPPIGERLERRWRLNWFHWWALVACLLVLAALVLA